MSTGWDKFLRIGACVGSSTLRPSIPNRWQRTLIPREKWSTSTGGVDGLGRIIEKQQPHICLAPSRARRLVCDGDVIVSTVRTYLRAIAPIRDPEPGTVVLDGNCRCAALRKVTTDYAAYALRAPYFVERVVANSKGVSFTYPALRRQRQELHYRLAGSSALHSTRYFRPARLRLDRSHHRSASPRPAASSDDAPVRAVLGVVENIDTTSRQLKEASGSGKDHYRHYPSEISRDRQRDRRAARKAFRRDCG